MRTLVPLFLLITAVLLPAYWITSPPSALPARFGPSECRIHLVTDGPGGRPLIGIEDVEPLGNGDGLMLAARDRQSEARPPGAIYTLSLFALSGGQRAARRIARDGPTALWPQGIGLSADGRTLAVADRLAPDRGAVRLFAEDENGVWRERMAVEDPGLCRVNDVLPQAGRVLATIDRSACGAAIVDLLPGASTGRLVSVTPGGIADVQGGIAYANGLAAGPGGQALVAETRGGRIQGLDARLPGGPDNLTRHGEAVVAALHPALPLLALYRAGIWPNAPSRVVRIAPSGAVEVLWDDPLGRQLSAVTGAAMTGGVLVAGSATEPGLLVCGLR